ncbi:unnamed protein product [Medioppia subpectinata]|uniref:Nuclear receptor domain-containing protein n=1 Tax=Medioppia subpectinata TaxID=1979941 RepID=A0A7R9KB66_9ACAR|nr:unnamed protein product [Medioppia subpectinata]CAG2099953.1 unnamed protein product [Medioppia subpectinata]
MDLVTAILLFNPYRSQLKHREVVKYKRWIYFHLLQRYLLLKYRSESEVKSRLRQLICAVCGDNARGYNFNVMSCVSCKTFFKRNAITNKEFKCNYNNNCEINALKRRFCPKCRLDKCFASGMRKEKLFNSEQKAMRINKMQENKRKRMITIPDLVNNEFTDKSSNCLRELMNATNVLQISSGRIITEVNTYLDEMVAIVKNAEQLVQRLVVMCKMLRGFNTICANDQIALLKYGSIELCSLRQFTGYDSTNHYLSIHSDNDNSILIKFNGIKSEKLYLFEAYDRYRTLQPRSTKDYT